MSPGRFRRSRELIRKGPLAFWILILYISCGAPSAHVEKTIENGIEVVLNQVEPYDLGSGPTSFEIALELTLDTERQDLAEIDFVGIGPFDADSAGNIYVASPESREDKVFKFDRGGTFILKFGREGQGPGEIMRVSSLTVDNNDRIVIFDSRNNKIVTYTQKGDVVGERKTDSGFFDVTPLANGNYLAHENIVDPTSEYITQAPLFLCSPGLDRIKELDKQLAPNPLQGKRLKGSYHVISRTVSPEMIFAAFQERGYEIYVYDFEGNFVRKIRKLYKPVALSDEYRKAFMDQFSAPMFAPVRDKIYFPSSRPPFHSILADESGRLLVMTYERGSAPGEYIFDIFSEEGICIGRKSLRMYFREDLPVNAKLKNGRLYCLDEKESGFMQLLVYRIVWL